jgi:two-component system, LytTR family, response regulator
MKRKTMILDDEIRGVKILEHLISNNENLELIGSFTDPEAAIDSINQNPPQLLILDIHMPKLNGFEVLRRINQQAIKVIFVTAYSEYAIKAFQYSAVDYILKPVEEQSFKDAIEKATSQITQTEIKTDIKTLIHNVSVSKNPLAMKLCIQHINGFNIIDSADVIYCEAESCYTVFKMIDGRQIISSKTLSEYEAILDQITFLRIHRSYIVNLAHVKEYKKGNGGSLILLGGVEVEVSRRKKEEFLNRMNNFISNVEIKA